MKSNREVRIPLESRADRETLVWEKAPGEVIESDLPKKMKAIILKRPAAAASKATIEEKEDHDEEYDEHEGGEEEEWEDDECEDAEGAEEGTLQQGEGGEEEEREDDALIEPQEGAIACAKDEDKGGKEEERKRILRKRPASSRELQEDFEVTTVNVVQAKTGKSQRAYLLAKNSIQKKQLIQISPNESRKYVQLVEKLKTEALEKLKHTRFLGMRRWAFMRKAELLQ